MARLGVMLCGHGSRAQGAVKEFSSLVQKLSPYLPSDWGIDYGYLEFANPVIRVGLDRLRMQGCDHILAVPGMLFAAMHAKNDIPAVLNAYAKEHDIRIDYGRELGVDRRMIKAAAARIEEALLNHDKHNPIARHDSCLVVIGRGSSDPDANSNINKIARMLWEGMGFGWCEVGYSGVTFPLVEPCLEHVIKLGFKRVVVFPYFLFSGILVDRIYGFTDMVAANNPDIELVKAGYLNDHPLVLETFAERATEILEGNTNMNCALCKYRAQILGFEHEVGTPQESHHHHVEGQGANAPGSNIANCTLCDDFCTGACRLDMDVHHHSHHDHSHHHHEHTHAPYPHASHPLGPESVRKHVEDKK